MDSESESERTAEFITSLLDFTTSELNVIKLLMSLLILNRLNGDVDHPALFIREHLHRFTEYPEFVAFIVNETNVPIAPVHLSNRAA